MKPRSPAQLALGRSLRAYREARELSQEQLAFESGLDRTYVGGVERGERNPSYEALRKLSDALETPLSEVIAGAEKLERPTRRA